MRITNQTHVNNLIRDLQLNENALLEIQRALASGRQVNRPGDDPAAALSAIAYERVRQRMDVFRKNIGSAGSFLRAAQTSYDSLQVSLQNARSIALAQGDGTASAESRRASAEVVGSIIEDVIHAANNRFRNRYLFSGTMTGITPFARADSGIIYRGDDGSIPVAVSPSETVETSVSGNEILGVLGTRLGGTDLDPAVYLGEAGGEATLLSAINGAMSFPAGRLEIRYSGGVEEVDLAGATDLRDVKDRIEAATGGVVTVGYTPDRKGLRLTETTSSLLQVSDLAGGAAATTLGISGSSATGVIDGDDLDPVITAFTRTADLNGGSGLDLSGFTVSHAGETRTVTSADIDGTVGELLRDFNKALDKVFLRLSPDASGIEMVARVSGRELTVTETGGSTASDLGFTPGTFLQDDAFNTLLDLRDALLSNDQDRIQDTVTRLDSSLSRLLDARARTGSRINRLETAGRRLEEQSLTVDELMSELVDANMAEMAVRLSERRTALEAALKAAAQVLPLSLVDFL